jgi:serine/threonine protein kinase
MSDLEGVILSEYFLLKCISKGGSADVYRGHRQAEGGYEVAVKVFRPGYAQRKSFRDYFMTEAEKFGQLDHPNILPFLEFGEGEGLLYTVTPFVPTGTLSDLLERVGGRLSAMQALPIMQQLCSAVQYAHDHNVTHGNIKPTNIFIAADGRVLLSDFGIARGYDDSQQSLTRIGWGSAEYAAPEQSLGVLRRSSDIYTSGVLLFRLLTGQPPFTGQTPVEVLLKHVRQQPPSVRVLAPNISNAVAEVLAKALQKRSDDRFASAQAFSDALTAAVNFAPVTSPVAQPVTVVRREVLTGPLLLTGDPQTPLPQMAFPSPVSMEPSSSAASADTSSTSDSEHLSNMLLAPEAPLETTEKHRATVVPRPAQVQKTLGKSDKASKSFLNKALPVVVVILLLLGLLAALLSSFLYSGGGTHSNSAAPLIQAALTISDLPVWAR